MRPVDFGLEEEAKSFSTYNHYLTSYRYVLEGLYGNGDEVLANLDNAVRSTTGFRNVEARERPQDLYEKALSNAWSTEAALYLPARLGGEELMPCANHWATIQAYYALYPLLRAFVAVRSGSEPVPRHAWLLEQISETTTGQKLFPSPWNVVCQGHQKAYSFDGLPQGVGIHEFSTLSRPRPEDAWSSVCKALKTTRKGRIEDRVKDWKKAKGRKRIPRDERQQLGVTMKATTVFNFLYRFRIRSNYRDADAFAAGTLRPADAVHFNESLRLLVSTSMFVLELIIDAYLGAGCLERVAKRFLERTPNMAEETLGKRLRYFEGS